MAAPTNRQQFKEYILRRLGAPVININVDDDQVEDRIDDALQYYQEYHHEATETVYMAFRVDADAVDRKYFPVPEDIVGISRVFSHQGVANLANPFDFQYQVAINDLYTLTSHSLIPYYMTMTHLSFVQNMLTGAKPMRYNKHANRLYIDVNFNNLVMDSFIVVEATRVLDPELYEDIWKDRWLQRYATQLVRRQAGENTKKFQGMQMPGGITYNGQQMYDEAVSEIARLEDEMLHMYSSPLNMFTG